MLNQKRDYLDENEKKNLKICMQILKRIIFSDDEDKLIKNMEAFKILLSVISTSPQLMTVSEAISLLKEILAANVRNCLIFIKMLGTVDLQILLLKLLFKEAEYDKLMQMEGFANSNMKKIACLYKFQHPRQINQEVQGPSKINNEIYETIQITEKEKMELFSEVDQLIISLSYILNPLHIMPCAALYSQILACEQLNPQFCLCMLDRLDLLIKEKIAK